MARVDIRGVLIPNNYKWFYDWCEEEATCPNDLKKAIEAMVPGEDLEVYINSPGGVIDVGSEIYTMLRSMDEGRVKIYITGEACSAASIVAMSGHCEMAPTALMMVHCVSVGGVNGNHNVMEQTGEMLRTADKALCTAYTNKTRMTEEEALAMMERETWLTASQAKELGLIDGIMFEETKITMTNSVGFQLPSQERMDRARAMMDASEKEKQITADRKKEMSCRLKMLSLARR